MVADVHRTLMYGGIYLYPADKAKVRHAQLLLFVCLVSLLYCTCGVLCAFAASCRGWTCLECHPFKFQTFSSLLRCLFIVPTCSFALSVFFSPSPHPHFISPPPLASSQGNGKLRVLYEGFPMAMIIEQAGGSAR